MYKKKILLAEDNQFILRSFKHLLSEQGYEVDTVCDGALVVSIVKEFQPDVLVLDLILPNINGFDILKELRSSKEFDTLPIIVATSLGQNEDKEIVMNLGATDYIIKSQITGKDLVDKITKVLE
ncbi:TPA: two-component system response regulator [Patescibacteria group bacterium]|nr:MAG: Alkaline phosphatase synthesis transcriptional regulatory protein phoP [Parcubacteria group bacterium GW2011_GWD2_42_14]HCC04800.1 two-component system response regulator [Patescibacteria group bacterium]